MNLPSSRHWSYQPVRRFPLPQVKDPDWTSNAIDSFVLARLEKNGLQPAPRASWETLIRRVTLDLTGLPPGLDKIDAFLADESEDAYEKAVGDSSPPLITGSAGPGSGSIWPAMPTPTDTKRTEPVPSGSTATG